MNKYKAIDENGMEYKLVSETKEGDEVTVDEKFIFITPYSILESFKG